MLALIKMKTDGFLKNAVFVHANDEKFQSCLPKNISAPNKLVRKANAIQNCTHKIGNKF